MVDSFKEEIGMKMVTTKHDVGETIVLNQKFLDYVCGQLAGAESPEAKLEYVLDGMQIIPGENTVREFDIQYEFVVYSVAEKDYKRKIFEVHRGEFNRLYCNFFELTRAEAEKINSILVLD